MERASGHFKSAETHFTEAYNKWILETICSLIPFVEHVYTEWDVQLLTREKSKRLCEISYSVSMACQSSRLTLFTDRKDLREASVITGRHRARMPVEYARSLLKLSEVLAQAPREKEESVKLCEESARLLLSRSPQATDVNCEKTFDDLVFIWWR